MVFALIRQSRSRAALLAVITFWLLHTGCPGSGKLRYDTITPKPEAASWNDGLAKTEGTGPWQGDPSILDSTWPAVDKPSDVTDRGGPRPEKTTPVIDQGTAFCGPAYAAATNSGKICTSAADCPATEACIGFGGTSGMCLGKCCPNLNNPADPVNDCPVSSPNLQASACFLEIESGGVKQNYMACGFVCAYTDGNGQTTTFACPNSTQYNCSAIDPNAPHLRLCVPK